MKALLLLALITVSEATIGVFVKLSDGLIPVQTLTFYAMAFAAVFLFIARALASREWPRFPRGNVKDTVIIGALIAAQGGVFNYAMTLVPMAARSSGPGRSNACSEASACCSHAEPGESRTKAGEP